MAWEAELAAAREVAELASQELISRYATFTAIPNAPVSISTDADRASQELILQWLHARFPADALIAEENTPSLGLAARTGERVWVVDPIDGTRGFARKNGQFSVMVGFVSQGRCVAGAVYEPVLGRRTWAALGHGCWCQDGVARTAVRCRVSRVPAIGQATLARSDDRGPSPMESAFAGTKIRRTFSAGIKLGLVARGEADIYPTRGTFHDWDLAAGQVLVEEAGGSVTNARGEPLFYGNPGALQNRGLLATNGLLHDLSLGIIRGMR